MKNNDTITGTTPKGIAFTAVPVAVRTIYGVTVIHDPEGTGLTNFDITTDTGRFIEYGANLKSLARVGRDPYVAMAEAIDYGV